MRDAHCDLFCWVQFTMGTRANQDLETADPEVINDYLGSSFKHMANYGESVYRPFMQVGHLHSCDPDLHSFLASLQTLLRTQTFMSLVPVAILVQ